MAKDILKYPGWMYAYGISNGNLDFYEARKEYSRIYHALKERQRRLRGTEFAKSSFAQKKLIPLSQIKSQAQFIEAIDRLASLARSRLTSVSGIRAFNKEIAAALDKYGEEGKSYADFTQSQWTEFGEFMKQVHKDKYDSEQAVREFKIAKGSGFTGASFTRDYTYWKDHEEELRQYYELVDRPFGKRVAAENVRNWIWFQKFKDNWE